MLRFFGVFTQTSYRPAEIIQLHFSCTLIELISDVAIGSYISDEVIILFGQPIVKLDAELHILDKNNVESEFVEVNEEDKFVKVCVLFSDRACDHVGRYLTASKSILQLSNKTICES